MIVKVQIILDGKTMLSHDFDIAGPGPFHMTIPDDGIRCDKVGRLLQGLEVTPRWSYRTIREIEEGLRKAFRGE